MRCLWLAGDVPYPVVSGLRAYSAGLAEALAGTGAEVVGLGLADGPPPPAAAVRWRPVAGRRAGATRRLASPHPSMAAALATPAYRAALDATLAAGPWDAVVVDHLQMGWAADRLGGTGAGGPKLVHVSHNHEARTRAAVARHRPWRSPTKVPLLLDAWKASRLERRLVRTAALVTAITDEDAAAFRPERGGRPLLTVLPAYDGPVVADRTITTATPRRAVMISNLDWHVKQANLVRFLDVADERFARAGVELVVAGPAPEAFVRQVAPRLRATTLLGRVDDLGEVLATARLGVVSEPEGGGFKLKTLDYVFHRVPMAVLAGSVTGLAQEPGRDHLAFPDEATLADGIVAAIDDLARLNTLQSRAFEACAPRFRWAARGEELRAALDAA